MHARRLSRALRWVLLCNGVVSRYYTKVRLWLLGLFTCEEARRLLRACAECFSELQNGKEILNIGLSSPETCKASRPGLRPAGLMRYELGLVCTMQGVTLDTPKTMFYWARMREAANYQIMKAWLLTFEIARDPVRSTNPSTPSDVTQLGYCMCLQKYL